MRGSTIKNVSAYEVTVGKLAKLILNGRVLAIDPSSGSRDSLPGYAIYEHDRITENGVVGLDYKQPIQHRLNKLFHFVDDLGHFDVLVIERIRGAQAHAYLHWAVGTVIAACRAEHVLEIPTTTWKKLARSIADYEKSDAVDALMMLGATLKIAQDAGAKSPKTKRKTRRKS